jgi:hypothetical protein
MEIQGRRPSNEQNKSTRAGDHDGYNVRRMSRCIEYVRVSVIVILARGLSVEPGQTIAAVHWTLAAPPTDCERCSTGFGWGPMR